MNRAAVFVHKFYFYSYEKHIHLNAVFVIYMIFTKGFYLQLKTTRSVNKWSINPPVKSEPRQADESPWRTATPHTLEPRCLQNLIQQKKLGAMLWMTISLNFTSSGKCKRWCVEDEKHCSGLAFLCVCCQELVEFCLVRLWLQTVNYSLQLGTTLCISRSDLKRLLGLIICWSINKSRLLHAVLRCALSEALPGCDVVYNASAAVGHVLQRGVEEIKGWRVLQVVWGRVGEAVKKQKTIIKQESTVFSAQLSSKSNAPSDKIWETKASDWKKKSFLKPLVCGILVQNVIIKIKTLLGMFLE